MYFLSDDQKSYFQDRSGLFGENLKRHILAISQGANALKTTPSALLADSPHSTDPHFKVSEGRPLRFNCAQNGEVIEIP
jgi:hypothetical protein